jgi:hypothetical protein
MTQVTPQKYYLIMTLMLLWIMLPVSASALPVDVELSLVIDASGSINAQEYLLQMQGYTDAFRNAAVQQAIWDGTYGRIAVNTILFESDSQLALDWMLIDSPG